MATCVSAQLVYVSQSSGGLNDSPVTVYLPVVPQPASVSACDVVLLTGAEAGNFLQAAEPFDPVVGAAFWSFALSFAVGCYFIAKNIGIIISAVKRW